MSDSDLRIKVLEEIQHVPEDQLSELYHLVHSFRISFTSNHTSPQSLMQFSGCWSDMSDETYTEWLYDISFRRQQAFSQRQNREASFD
ncbi:MAG: hypothetical protein HC936_05665 [Leptolyngbyaceae cyanobacterium SU_3_3]|nr:hypothetical protein [Leptolyngbyaceae cyanobacterium SU_3_3]